MSRTLAFLLFVAAFASTLFSQSLPPARPSTDRPAPGKLVATFATPATNPLFILDECEIDMCGKQHGLWIFDGSQGQAVWTTGSSASMTLERSGNSVTIHRADLKDSPSNKFSPTGQFKAMYTGTISGNSIDSPVGMTLEMGTVAAPGHWQATICPSLEQCSSDIKLLTTLGVNAYLAGLHPLALAIFQVGANKGYPNAQGDLAYVLSEEGGTAATKDEVFRLATASASKNSIVGMKMLSKAYREGIGTPVNLQMADYWWQQQQAQQQTEEAQAKAQDPNQTMWSVARALMQADTISPEEQAAMDKAGREETQHNLSLINQMSPH